MVFRLNEAANVLTCVHIAWKSKNLISNSWFFNWLEFLWTQNYLGENSFLSKLQHIGNVHVHYIADSFMFICLILIYYGPLISVHNLIVYMVQETVSACQILQTIGRRKCSWTFWRKFLCLSNIGMTSKNV